MAEKIASFYTELRESEYLSKIHYDESQTIMNLILCAAKHIEDEDILNIICRKLFVCELDESNKKDVSILIKNVCYVWNSANEKGYSPDNKDYIPVEENGVPVIDPEDPSRYILKPVKSETGTVLPTLGIMIEF